MLQSLDMGYRGWLCQDMSVRVSGYSDVWMHMRALVFHGPLHSSKDGVCSTLRGANGDGSVDLDVMDRVLFPVMSPQPPWQSGDAWTTGTGRASHESRSRV